MKIRNLTLFASLILVGALSTAFVRPVEHENKFEKNGKISFAEFLSYFKKADMPLEICVDDFGKYEKFRGDAISRLAKARFSKIVETQKQKFVKPFPRTDFIPEIAWGKFGRGGLPSVQPVAYFYPNKKSVAVIYTTSHRYAAEVMENYKLLVFDLGGNVIFPESESKLKSKKKKARKVRAGFQLGSSSVKNTLTFKIDEKGNVEQQDFENVWKTSLEEKPFFENELLGFELQETIKYQFDGNGLLEKVIPEKSLEVQSDARASLD